MYCYTTIFNESFGIFCHIDLVVVVVVVYAMIIMLMITITQKDYAM